LGWGESEAGAEQRVAAGETRHLPAWPARHAVPAAVSSAAACAKHTHKHTPG
jgi:hypothetical protein